jgi:hypothetical protein
VLTEHESDPQIWQAPLRAELAHAGGGEDQDLFTARTLASLLKQPGHRDSTTAVGDHSMAVSHNEGIISTGRGARNYLRRPSPDDPP